MKYYQDFSEQKYTPGSQPHKVITHKDFGKGKKLHSFFKDEEMGCESNKFRASYKRAENKNMMRNQLRDMQAMF